MDMQTLAYAIAIASKALPTVTSADQGEVLTVGYDGKWTTGAVTGMVLSVSGHTLSVTEGGE